MPAEGGGPGVTAAEVCEGSVGEDGCCRPAGVGVGQRRHPDSTCRTSNVPVRRHLVSAGRRAREGDRLCPGRICFVFHTSMCHTSMCGGGGIGGEGWDRSMRG